MGVAHQRVLVVEDSDTARAVISSRLRQHGIWTIEAPDGETAVAMCRTDPPDVVVLDVVLPGIDGYGVLRAIKADPLLRDIEVVFLTGELSADDVANALDMGAHDYLRKPVVTIELIARVRAALRTKALRDELWRRNQDLESVAFTDVATGLPNRRGMGMHLRAVSGLAGRHGVPYAVLMIDIDGFKAVNDRWGHDAGDTVLVEVSRRIGTRVRAEDVAGRWGGEEFLVVLPHTGLGAATVVAEALRRRVAADPIDVGDDRVEITVSIGCASGDDADVDAVVRLADAALYDAKRAGRDAVRFADAAL